VSLCCSAQADSVSNPYSEGPVAVPGGAHVITLVHALGVSKRGRFL
jgi:hypothetical protein